MELRAATVMIDFTVRTVIVALMYIYILVEIAEKKKKKSKMVTRRIAFHSNFKYALDKSKFFMQINSIFISLLFKLIFRIFFTLLNLESLKIV